MKIFLTGTSGMLASDVVPIFKNAGHEVLETDIRPRHSGIKAMDLMAPAHMEKELERFGAEYLFHFAAETDVDYCQAHPDFDIPLLSISTAGVFGGEKAEAYTEFDEPGPANIYGESKLQGEKIIEKLLSKYFILRAGWMVGRWEIDKKFVYKIIKQIEGGKTEIKAVDDKLGTPTFTKAFARNLWPVLKTGRYGLYHMTNKGTCSRYDIAVKIVELLGLADSVRVIPVSSGEFPLPAPRARSEMLRNYRLDLLGLNHMPHWEEALAEYIQTHGKQKDGRDHKSTGAQVHKGWDRSN